MREESHFQCPEHGRFKDRVRPGPFRVLAKHELGGLGLVHLLTDTLVSLSKTSYPPLLPKSYTYENENWLERQLRERRKRRLNTLPLQLPRQLKC